MFGGKGITKGEKRQRNASNLETTKESPVTLPSGEDVFAVENT